MASGRAHSIQQIVDQLLALSKVSITVQVDPARYRPVDVPVIYGSAERLWRDTGWEPCIPLVQTIQDVLNEWRIHVRNAGMTSITATESRVQGGELAHGN